MAEERFGTYRLQQLLASGGMGEVFLARHEGPKGFAKSVVVKRILRHLARDPAFVEMFLNEARLAALLTHPNIVQIFELGEEQGQYFIAMEWVHGHTVRSMKAQAKKSGRPFAPAYAARIAAAALHGLHYAHTLRGANGQPLGIVHRDMSPDNVMVGFDGGVKILDFGIAKVASAVGTTEVGTVKGKRAYMSPEQLDGTQVDGRTDVWSVGVMLYELIAGERPFPAEEEGPLVRQILGAEPPLLSARVPGVPEALSAIVHEALSKDPARRHATAEVMATALERFVMSARVSLADATLASFLAELYQGEAAGAAEAGPHSGLYLSRAVRSAAEPSRVTRVFTGVRSRWRALVLGGVFAGLLVASGLALSYLGGKKPPLKPAIVDPLAQLPTGPVEPPTRPEPSTEPADVHPRPAEPGARPVEPPRPPPSQRGPARGKVDVRVKPWADVYEGKKKLGTTPMQPIELSAGKHVLTFRNPDLKVSKNLTVRVPRDGTTTVRVDLR